MSLFDAYFCIDWSGRNSPSPAKPSPDAVWLGEHAADGSATETYFRTRDACIQDLRTRLRVHSTAQRRVLVGFDFPFGYPQGFAGALGLGKDDAPWRSLWHELDRRISDDALNHNNRLRVAGELNQLCRPPDAALAPGPFWGCPHGRTVSGLSPRSPGFPYLSGDGAFLPRLRLADRRCRGIQEGWKLYGTGSVGSQALLGLPRVLRLREDPALAPFSHIWPFETAMKREVFTGPGPRIVHAEVWPSLRGASLDPRVNPRDRAQVRAVVAWMAETDARGELAAWLELPADLTPEEREAVVTEEGWILGVGRLTQ